MKTKTELTLYDKYKDVLINPIELYKRLSAYSPEHYVDPDYLGVDPDLVNVYWTKHGPLIHIDRGCDTLGVAHLDHVRFTRPYIDRETGTVYCPQLDDRLGAYVILDLLPKMGVECDIILCDSEESGQSTAQYFIGEKVPDRYNWGFEFDRNGTDNVFYQYEDTDLCKDMVAFGFDLGFGSFSDISELGHLGIAFVNLGVGYYNQHTLSCHAKLSETLAQAKMFANFWHEHHQTKYPFVETYRSSGGYRSWGRAKRNYSYTSGGLWYRDDDDYDGTRHWEDKNGTWQGDEFVLAPKDDTDIMDFVCSECGGETVFTRNGEMCMVCEASELHAMVAAAMYDVKYMT